MQIPDYENIWDGQYKIPWNDPDFSRRMLKEHLNQDHDLASRNQQWIDQQVTWIHEQFLHSQPSKILDLGCGPGFYTKRFAALGHTCHGIDFSPASIEYARQSTADMDNCTFNLADIRQVELSGPYNLAIFLYGEFNVFSPTEIRTILTKIHHALDNHGILLIEPILYDAVKGFGQADSSENQADSGLFSDHPHHCRIENHWLDDQQTTLQTFQVTETQTNREQTFRSTTKAWNDSEIQDLLVESGFSDISRQSDWPCNINDLVLWSAKRNPI